jgi:hypothetical protein
MTKIFPIRLTENEFEMLDEILNSENCESENRSEWFRLLLYREWNKRKKLGVPSVTDYQTAFRLCVRSSRIRKCNTQSPVQLDQRKRNTDFGDRRAWQMVRSGKNPATMSAREFNRLLEKVSPALSNFSPSPTRAANGVLVRTKSSRVTRRAGLKKPAGKLK